MKNIYFVFYGIVLLLLFSCSLKREKVTDQNQPNIVVIVADDLGWNDVGYHGSEIRTPSIAKRAQNSISARIPACK